MPPIDLEGGTNRCVSTKDDDEDNDKAGEMDCSACSDSIFNLPLLKLRNLV